MCEIGGDEMRTRLLPPWSGHVGGDNRKTYRVDEGGRVDPFFPGTRARARGALKLATFPRIADLFPGMKQTAEANNWKTLCRANSRRKKVLMFL